MTNTANGRVAREQRQVDAQRRSRAYNLLTPEQRIQHLDAMLGKGKGAKRQRARLAALV